MMKISFDIGGVLSKYPSIFKPMIKALLKGGVEVHVLTDMHDKQHVLAMLAMNDLGVDIIPEDRVHTSDYIEHGERCKQVILEELKIDLHFDDFPGYAAAGGSLQALIWPNPDLPYWSDDWQTDPKDGEFGRRKPKKAEGGQKAVEVKALFFSASQGGRQTVPQTNYRTTVAIGDERSLWTARFLFKDNVIFDQFVPATIEFLVLPDGFETLTKGKQLSVFEGHKLVAKLLVE